jgi:polyketide-type polyunsaturated fatty acid synthase PfaA
MASVFPQAMSVREFWDNIIMNRDCIEDVPSSRWNVEDYYDPDPTTPDKTYSKRGGFLPDIDFDPMEFGLPPNILEVTDVSQMLGLVVARDALNDAGYGNASAELRDKTGCVLGVGGGQKLIMGLNARLQYPVWRKALASSGIVGEDAEIIVKKIQAAYIRWEENSFPGLLGNVIAGRIANRLDLGGMNCVVDAACASSMGAMKLAISDLVEGRSDMMITGGVDTDNSIFMYMSFSKTPAFTPGTHPRPFDITSDGMMIGEGVGMIVLKRLEDAERDGDKIYAVIRGIGASSDGRYKSIYAPRGEGQEKALDRAYEDAGISPNTVGLIEAHGTGTAAGDMAETTTIVRFFNKHGDYQEHGKHVALGSVKSQIGHTKAAAGIAGLMKVALALHHKMLPPTTNVVTPNPKLGLDQSPLYVNTETRPWITDGKTPRRAGVSSFGFGGTNFHFVLEEYRGDHEKGYRLHKNAETILFHAPTPEALMAKLERHIARLEGDEADAQYLNMVQFSRDLNIPASDARLGFVAGDAKESLDLLRAAHKFMNTQVSAVEWQHPKGIFYRREAMTLTGKVVALFSGQGAQYVGMGRELAFNFPAVRQSFAHIDRLFHADKLSLVSDVVYPQAAFTDEAREAQAQMLQRTDYVQPSIGALSAGMFKMFKSAGFKPDFAAGHSFGELTALWASDVLSDDDYYALVKARGLAMAPPPDPTFNAGTMMAVTGDVAKVRGLVANATGVHIANINSPTQVVLAGKADDLDAVKPTLQANGFNVVPLSVSAAFHTPLVGHAQAPFAKAIAGATFKAPTVKVYSNASANPYPQDAGQIRQILSDHILNAVNFSQEIENIYNAGGYVFIEFGPRNILTNLVKDILGNKPHVAIALNGSRQKDSDRQFREALAQLRVLGLSLGAIDPYAQDPVVGESAGRKKGMQVKISGGAYISEKTRQNWTNTLNDGHRIAGGGTVEVIKEVVKEVIKEVPVEVRVEVPVPVNHGVGTVTVSNTNQPTSLEQALALFSEQQSAILKAHQHYLDNQSEYIRVFATLAGQHQAAVSNGISKESAESLAKSMDAFHHHQAETLRVHETYLHRQSEQTQALLTLMRGNGNGVAPTTISAPQPTATIPAPTPVMTPPPAPTPVEAPKPSVAPVVTAPVPQPVVVQAPPPVVVSTPAPTPVASGLSLELLSTSLLAIVSEKTGYPTEMLELGMDIEADLGIDSIKRVEILGAMRDQYPQLPQLKAEELGELRTLQQIVEFMGSRVGASSSPTSVSAPVMTTPAPTPVVAQTVAPVVTSTPAPQPIVTSAPTNNGGLSLELLSTALLAIVSEKTGYPTEMLELGMDIEADLGIDSIKRVEILGAMRDQYPQLPQLKAEELGELRTLEQIVEFMGSRVGAGSSPIATTPAPTPVVAQTPAPVVTSTPAPQPVVTSAPSNGGGLSLEVLSGTLLEIVSEKTGYPTEMLELGMDIEADLGIDSIKRVEILGAMRDQYPQLPQLKAEELGELRTLQQIVEFMGSRVNSGDTNGVSAGESAHALPKVDAPVAIVNGDGGVARPQLVISTPVARSAVYVRYLPPPDELEIALPNGAIALVTDDGTSLTTEVVKGIQARGWRVVVLNLPADMVKSEATLPAGVPRYALSDATETRLEETLKAIQGEHGTVGVFIHLNPPASAFNVNGNPFLDPEKGVIKHIFLMAKHLKKSLTDTAENGYGAFVTVARLDGALGANGTFNAVIEGGLFGLTKSLNLEWTKVFCRALDVADGLSAETASHAILRELSDPNRLVVEVGIGTDGRVTLVAPELS